MDAWAWLYSILCWWSTSLSCPSQATSGQFQEVSLPAGRAAELADVDADKKPDAGQFREEAAEGRRLRALLGGDDTYSKYTAQELPNRSMFLFIHQEKSAGSYLGEVFKNALPDNELNYHDYQKPIRHVPANYFVVSSIREPCDQAVSSWSFCCQTFLQAQYTHHVDHAGGCGKTISDQGACPTFKFTPEGGTEVVSPNSQGFELFVRTSEIGQKLSPAFHYGSAKYEWHLNFTFQHIGLSRVDCWVRYESLEDDAQTCIDRFHQLTGAKVVRKEEKSKNVGHHSPCAEYYSDKSTISHIRGNNSFIFDYFHYECCA